MGGGELDPGGLCVRFVRPELPLPIGHDLLLRSVRGLRVPVAFLEEALLLLDGLLVGPDDLAVADPADGHPLP